MAGEAPVQPVAMAALAEAARAQIESREADYVFGAAGSEDTMRGNEAAFARWRIVPRMLRDTSVRDLGVTVLGTELPAPLGLAPIGAQSIVHEEGELAVARAAGAVGLPMAVSTVSSHPLEAIAAQGGGPKWFQLYWPSDRELVASLVSRAEAAGYQAVIVTVDTVVPGWKPRELQAAWQPVLQGIGIANYVSDPVFRASLEQTPEENMQAAVGQWIATYSDPTVTWENLAFLRENTKLPILLKGILHPEDATRAVQEGVDGIVVSNHGGRQVDGEIASLDALPAVVDEVGDDLAVLLDSGVRCGADAVKALALGADAVLIGRPYLWGLAAGGEPGVLTVLRSLLAELDLTIGLTGHTRPDELTPGLLVREP